jgi:hypothetical protein
MLFGTKTELVEALVKLPVLAGESMGLESSGKAEKPANPPIPKGYYYC